MSRENDILPDIVSKVYAAKNDVQAADELVRQYMPFIKSETAKFIHRLPEEGHDDELSIAMFAFHQAVLSYSRLKGAFLHYASVNIKNRLIDYYRSEARYYSVVSLDNTEYADDKTGHLANSERADESEDIEQKSAAKAEINEFAVQLDEFNLSLADIAENCPKQKRTLSACGRVLNYAKANPKLLEILTETKKLPISQLSAGAGVERKTIERHRKYIIAIMLAYTNGYEIIRGHLNQVIPGKGAVKV